MSRPRDSQRSKVYAAERAAFGGTHPGAEPHESMTLVARRVDAIMASTYVRSTFPYALGPMRLGDGRGRRRPCGSSRGMKLPSWGRQPGNWWVLYHELAHVLQSREEDHHRSWAAHAGHGWRFCQVYLALVRACRGEADARKLEAAFRAHRVRLAPPRAKRRATPAQLAALAAGRAKRDALPVVTVTDEAGRVVARGRGTFRVQGRRVTFRQLPATPQTCRACEPGSTVIAHTCGLRQLQELLRF